MMQYITYINRYGKECKMWTRVSFLNDKTNYEILKKEGNGMPSGCWEDYVFLTKEDADYRILKWATTAIEMKYISNLEVH